MPGQWSRKNRNKPNYNVEKHRWFRYGLTPETYEELLASQNYVCAICGTDNWGGPKGTPCVDHDHVTETVRGLLCIKCNSSISYLKESVEILENAIAYLRSRWEPAVTRREALPSTTE